MSGFSLPRPCYDAGWKSLLYLCHLRLSHCHHATLWLLFCGGTKLLQPRLQRCSLSLAPFRIITDWLLTSPLPQRIYKFITQLIPSDTLWPLKVLRNQSHWKCTLWTWKMSSKIDGWRNGATGEIYRCRSRMHHQPKHTLGVSGALHNDLFFFFGSRYHITHVSWTVRITSMWDSITSAFEHASLFVGPTHIFFLPETSVKTDYKNNSHM